MSNIEPTIEIPQGDTRQLPFTVTQDGSGRDLSDITIEWELGDGLLTLADDGVSVVNRDNDAGTFAIELSSDATSNVGVGLYPEVVTLTDANGNVTQFSGRISIDDI